MLRFFGGKADTNRLAKRIADVRSPNDSEFLEQHGRAWNRQPAIRGAVTLTSNPAQARPRVRPGFPNSHTSRALASLETLSN